MQPLGDQRYVETLVVSGLNGAAKSSPGVQLYFPKLPFTTVLPFPKMSQLAPSRGANDHHDPVSTRGNDCAAPVKTLATAPADADAIHGGPN